MDPQRLKARTQAARGLIPVELVLDGAQVFDVFSGRWLRRNIAIFDGVIVAVEADRIDHGLERVDCSDRFIVPGWIDAHTHVESSMMLPASFEKAVLPRGTTTAICDPHEIANVIGKPGLEYFVESAPLMNMNLQVMMSSCVPATHLETNGGGTISAEDLASFRGRPNVLGLAEMMNVPGVLNSDPAILDKIFTFQDQRLDGHAPLLRGQDLSAYALCGISSCHESSELEEAREKLEKGIAVWIREGSVAKDLTALAPLLDTASSSFLGFCSDDRNPLEIAQEGHLDYLLRKAIRLGVSPEAALRAASMSVARHYGLDRGWKRIGAIAPGYVADLVILGDVETVSVVDVYKSGKNVRLLGTPRKVNPSMLQNTVKASRPNPVDLIADSGRVNVIGVIPGKIITDHLVMNSEDEGVARLTVLERYGRGSKPANAYVHGFGKNFKGAIASSVGHDSHNLICVGSNVEDMAIAMGALIDRGGGFSVVSQKSEVAHLALPYGGLMSDQSPEVLAQAIGRLKEATCSLGCDLSDPFLQLAFLSLPVIPSLKLTDRGLVDVNRFAFISVRSS